MITALPHPRFILFFAVFAAGLGLGLPRLDPADALVAGFDLAAVVFIGSCLPLWRADGLEAMRARTARDDGGRGLLLLVAVLVLAAVLLALGRMIETRKSLVALDFALVAGTLVLAWLFVNLVYALHYAHLFHDQKTGRQGGGLEFPGNDTPLFADFCYFSFVIGMTCQVSDVTILTTPMRRVATVHGLFAFFFNLVVLALTLNVMSGVL